jgi:hypothetical protein
MATGSQQRRPSRYVGERQHIGRGYIRLVLIRPKIYLAEGQCDVLCAMLLPGRFAITALVSHAFGRLGAIVEPMFGWPLRVPVEGDEAV